MRNKKTWFWVVLLLTLIGGSPGAFASEAHIDIPDLTQVKFPGLGGVTGSTLMYMGIVVCAIGAVFGLVQYMQTKALPVHESMANVSNTIWETCKTYLFTQGKFLAILWLLIAACMIYYFIVLPWNDPDNHFTHGQLILASIEAGTPNKDEVIGMIGNAPSLRFLSELNDSALRNLESQWHKIYIGWHSVLGQLKVQRQNTESKSMFGAMFEKKK